MKQYTVQVRLTFDGANEEGNVDKLVQAIIRLLNSSLSHFDFLSQPQISETYELISVEDSRTQGTANV